MRIQKDQKHTDPTDPDPDPVWIFNIPNTDLNKGKNERERAVERRGLTGARTDDKLPPRVHRNLDLKF